VVVREEGVQLETWAVRPMASGTSLEALLMTASKCGLIAEREMASMDEEQNK
jgi:hypothetical protein